MEKKANNKLRFVIDLFITIVCAFVISCGVKIFISPNKFLSTGVTGLSLILGRICDNVTGKDLETTIAGIAYYVMNVPILIMAWKRLSKRFAILSIVNVTVTAICLTLLPNDLNERLHLSVAQEQISFLDAALFVGMMNGAANGVAFMVGGSGGGTDVISMYFSVKKQTTVGKITTSINAFIIVLGIFVDGSDLAIAKAFYTLVYLIISSLVIDLFYNRNRRNILLITTTKGKEVSQVINNEFVRGVTTLDAKGSFTGEHKDFLYCACSLFEVNIICKRIKEVDEHAFISVVGAKKVFGNFINKDLR